METTTSRLTNILKSRIDIRTVLIENESSINSPTLQAHLESLLSLKGMKRQDVIKSAQLDYNYANQLFNGRRTKPGRDQALSLAFGFRLNNEEANRLLRAAGAGALHPKNKRDAVIVHSLENRKSVLQTNEVLFTLGLDVLLGVCNNKMPNGVTLQ